MDFGVRQRSSPWNIAGFVVLFAQDLVLGLEYVLLLMGFEVGLGLETKSTVFAIKQSIVQVTQQFFVGLVFRSFLIIGSGFTSGLHQGYLMMLHFLRGTMLRSNYYVVWKVMGAGLAKVFHRMSGIVHQGRRLELVPSIRVTREAPSLVDVGETEWRLHLRNVVDRHIPARVYRLTHWNPSRGRIPLPRWTAPILNKTGWRGASPVGWFSPLKGRLLREGNPPGGSPYFFGCFPEFFCTEPVMRRLSGLRRFLFLPCVIDLSFHIPLNFCF